MQNTEFRQYLENVAKKQYDLLVAFKRIKLAVLTLLLLLLTKFMLTRIFFYYGLGIMKAYRLVRNYTLTNSLNSLSAQGLREFFSHSPESISSVLDKRAGIATNGLKLLDIKVNDTPTGILGLPLQHPSEKQVLALGSTRDLALLKDNVALDELGSSISQERTKAIFRFIVDNAELIEKYRTSVYFSIA